MIGEFHEQRSLAGYTPWGHKESDTTKLLTHTHKKHTHGPGWSRRIITGWKMEVSGQKHLKAGEKRRRWHHRIVIASPCGRLCAKHWHPTCMISLFLIAVSWCRHCHPYWREEGLEAQRAEVDLAEFAPLAVVEPALNSRTIWLQSLLFQQNTLNKSNCFSEWTLTSVWLLKGCFSHASQFSAYCQQCTWYVILSCTITQVSVMSNRWKSHFGGLLWGSLSLYPASD